MVKTLLDWGRKAISGADVCWAIFFVVIFSWQPDYAQGPLNIFELSLYLPSIDGILHGLVPFRDFFYLRGPLEIYPPALIMKIFGEHVAYLSLYFYLGNVLCLLVAALIAAELLKTRLLFYAFIPALIARAFPRVVYAFWGGMRYVWGLLFIYVMIWAFKTQRRRFFAISGILAACAAFTSIEIGACCFMALAVSFILMRVHQKEKALGQIGACVIGSLCIIFPFVIYLISVGAMIPFMDDMQAVVFKSHPTFMTHLTSHSPKTALQFVLAMFPGSSNFKYMTPLYCFLLIIGILVWRHRRKMWGWQELAIANLLVYALVLYMEAFRIIEGGQFETALQVEKILYFVGLEAIALWALGRYRQITVICLVSSLIFSWGYALDRYYKRFPVFSMIRSHTDKKFAKKEKLKKEAMMGLDFDRALHVKTSPEQAQELNMVVGNIEKYTGPEDKIFVYPDMGAYYFFADRGFVGHFPLGTLAWMRPDWHEQLMHDLNEEMPKLIVLEMKLPADYKKVYFKRPSNETEFSEIIGFINTHYDLVATTPLSGIYLRKN